uniref:Uncharacterized protein n=1 Tax=Rhizophagus irregularis (strain DAOM 181602 / DAOM 197198 / MUCL 43194) TaxID=747089 RepID=U9UM52_RHIID
MNESNGSSPAPLLISQFLVTLLNYTKMIQYVAIHYKINVKNDKYFEGVLLYDVKEKKAYVYSVKNDHKFDTFSKWITGLKKQGLFKGYKSALTTIFLESNPTSIPIASILCFENIVCIRGNQLVSNTQEHAVLAILENKGQSDEVYRHINCMLVVKNSNKKIEEEGGEISDEMEKIAYTATENVTSKNIDISNFHPIFQELICIQSEKPNGVRYHPMFLRWAISVYSKSGKAAYNVMKTIMRLPSISTLKSYINESEQYSGWQDKIAYQILASLTTNKIWGYGRVGFFSHDSFKIQKGLLWSQRENCYVGYLDFEDEMQDYQSFALQCQCEISGENNSLSNTISEKQKQKNELATQIMHRINKRQDIWNGSHHNVNLI